MTHSSTTTIASGLRLKGDLVGTGDLRVEGRFEGSIQIEGLLHVASGAEVFADVTATRVRIDGRLQGRVCASQQIAIGSKGCLIGDVQGLLAIQEGGVFHGEVEIEVDTVPGEEPPPIPTGPVEAPPTRLVQRAPPPPKLPERPRARTNPSAERALVEIHSDDRVTAAGPQPVAPPRRTAPAGPGPSRRKGPARQGTARPVRGAASTAPARRTKASGSKKNKGRRVLDDPEDLSDDWFEDQDYLVPKQ